MYLGILVCGNEILKSWRANETQNMTKIIIIIKTSKYFPEN